MVLSSGCQIAPTEKGAGGSTSKIKNQSTVGKYTIVGPHGSHGIRRLCGPISADPSLFSGFGAPRSLIALLFEYFASAKRHRHGSRCDVQPFVMVKDESYWLTSMGGTCRITESIFIKLTSICIKLPASAKKLPKLPKSAVCISRSISSCEASSKLHVRHIDNAMARARLLEKEQV